MNKTAAAFFRAVGLFWTKVFRLQSKDGAFHCLLYRVLCCWVSARGWISQPQLLSQPPAAILIIRASEHSGMHQHLDLGQGHTQAPVLFPTAQTGVPAKVLLHRSHRTRAHFSWTGSAAAAGNLSCNTAEVCFSFCLCGISGGVMGLTGCFSFGFFMLVLCFIWQWGLTALLEIGFIFSSSSRMPLGCETFVNKNVFLLY